MGELKDENELNAGRIVPVYSLTESLNIKKLRKIIYDAVELFAHVIKDPFPDEFKKNVKLIEPILIPLPFTHSLLFDMWQFRVNPKFAGFYLQESDSELYIDWPVGFIYDI